MDKLKDLDHKVVYNKTKNLVSLCALINNLKIKAKEGHAEEKIKDNKYGEALKLYESILSECTLTKNEMCTINDKMKEIEGLKVKSYVEKLDEYISRTIRS